MNRGVVIVIPVLNPNKIFLEYVKELIENSFEKIIVVNDGSVAKYQIIFEYWLLTKKLMFWFMM